MANLLGAVWLGVVVGWIVGGRGYCRVFSLWLCKYRFSKEVGLGFVV